MGGAQKNSLSTRPAGQLTQHACGSRGPVGGAQETLCPPNRRVSCLSTRAAAQVRSAGDKSSAYPPAGQLLEYGQVAAAVRWPERKERPAYLVDGASRSGTDGRQRRFGGGACGRPVRGGWVSRLSASAVSSHVRWASAEKQPARRPIAFPFPAAVRGCSRLFLVGRGVVGGACGTPGPRRPSGVG